jgi:hypothetical protein
MIERWKTHFREDPLFFLLCLGAMILPLSNAVGQIPLYLASVWWTVRAFRQGTPVSKVSLVFLAGYVLIVLVSLTYAVRPMNGIGKLNRFLLFPIALAVPALVAGSEDKRWRLVASFLFGAALLGVYDLIRIPWQVVVNDKNLFHMGSMTSPQFFMTALLLLLGLGWGTGRLPRWHALLYLVLFSGGFLIHNKRGAWLACLLALVVWVLWSRRWKILLAASLAMALASTLPSVRERLVQVREIISPTHGSRMTLWQEVSPRLLPAYPFGMGYNGSEFEDFRKVTPRDIHIQPGLRHLHNNFLQTRLELGWHGLAWWSAWMAWILWKAFGPNGPGNRLQRGAVGCALLGLILNGFVEYNFGDSEILMLFLLFLGLLLSWTPSQADPSAVAPS